MTEHPLPDEVTALGLPSATVADLESVRPARALYQVYSWSFFVVMVAGFAVGGFWLWPTAESAVQSRVIAEAVARDAWLYDSTFGFSMLALLFAWIWIGPVPTSWLISCLPARSRWALARRVLEDPTAGQAAVTTLRERLEAKEGQPSATAVADGVLWNGLGGMSRFGLVLVALSGALFVQEYRSHDIYTAEGLERRPILPWKPEATHRWSAVESVALGCNQTGDGPSLIYEPRWPDGPSPRLAQLTVLGDRTRLETLEAIDALIAAGGARFERWQWRDRDPLEPRCLGAYRAAVGPENAGRVDRLLRVGEFPGDGGPDI